MPVIEAIRQRYSDFCGHLRVRSGCFALAAGADIINDITGLLGDENMAEDGFAKMARQSLSCLIQWLVLNMPAQS